MQSYEFYHQHLLKVSRSFSFCIMHLEAPAKMWVALAYLLLRIIDTIEDAPWEDEEAQLQAFAQFRDFLNAPPTPLLYKQWLSSFPVQVSAAEKSLLLDLPLLLKDKQQLPKEIQHHLLNTMLQMMDGMIYFIQHHKKNNQLRLTTIEQIDEYCVFVAGIVGELLTHIFAYFIVKLEVTPTLLKQSLHFGIYLQKINLLKDRTEDELAGRFFVPSYLELRESLFLHARLAMDYIKELPVSAKGYRLFCAWSFFIGLASLKWIDKNWQNQQSHKISRKETTALIFKVQQWIDNNYELEILYERYLS